MKFLISLLLFVSFNTFANPYIEFVVRSGPGGTTDVLTRKLAEQIEKETKLQIVVQYRPGAGHAIAYRYFESANKPVLIMADKDSLDQNQMLFMLGNYSSILMVNSKSNIKSFDDLIKLSAEREIIFGHNNEGSDSFATADINCQKVLRCLLVPYKSGGQAMIGLAEGTIDAFTISTYGSNMFLGNDQYRAIMTYSPYKHAIINVPALPK
jgi:tripartite-type tricarboxylate transporter receptor subunit TctC